MTNEKGHLDRKGALFRYLVDNWFTFVEYAGVGIRLELKPLSSCGLHRLHNASSMRLWPSPLPAVQTYKVAELHFPPQNVVKLLDHKCGHHEPQEEKHEPAPPTPYLEGNSSSHLIIAMTNKSAQTFFLSVETLWRPGKSSRPCYTCRKEKVWDNIFKKAGTSRCHIGCLPNRIADKRLTKTRVSPTTRMIKAVVFSKQECTEAQRRKCRTTSQAVQLPEM